jgi:hypothetical protein
MTGDRIRHILSPASSYPGSDQCRRALGPNRESIQSHYSFRAGEIVGRECIMHALSDFIVEGFYALRRVNVCD